MRTQPRPFSSPDRPNIKWSVNYTDAAGKRKRRFFKNKRQAEVFISSIEADVAGAGREATLLSPDCKRMAVEAFKRLEPYNVSLLDVVNAFIAERTAEEQLQAEPIGVLVEQFLNDLRASNLRPRTTRALANELGRFAERMGNDRPVARIGEADCRRYIFEAGASPRTSTNRRLRLGRFFRWALKQGHVLANPVEGIEPPKNEAPRPDILSVEEARRLMQLAAELADGKWRAYTAVCLFCGLRPEAEAERLDWSDVDLGGRTIVVRSGKLRQRRVVEIPENAVAWLAGVAKSSGPVAPDKRGGSPTMRDVREQACIHHWQPDKARHTALSYRLALLGDEGRVAAWAGNSPTVLHRHYRALTTRDQAERFFAITPDSGGELIRFGSSGEAEAEA